MPRILFLSERYPPDAGGVATSAGRISRTLASLGAYVDVVCWTRALEAGQVERAEGNPGVYRIGRFREWDSTMPHTLNLLDWLRGTHPYSAVWGHYLSVAGFLATWFGNLNAIPSVVSIRGNDLDRDVFPPGDFSRAEWTLSHAEHVIAVTKELARKAAALSGREDIAHMANVVDSDVFMPGPAAPALRAALGIEPGEAVLGFAGELREKKGLPHLLRALKTVQERRPACLLAIGDVRPSETHRLMDAQRVLITGQLATPAAVNEHLRLCDVYLQPSVWDGMPNALLEAMAAGCGCIASDAGGIPEIVEGGVNGIIVPRWQLHRLGEAVLEWLNAPEADRQRIRSSARHRAVTAFHPDREASTLQRLLAAFTSDSPARSQV